MDSMTSSLVQNSNEQQMNLKSITFHKFQLLYVNVKPGLKESRYLLEWSLWLGLMN